FFQAEDGIRDFHVTGVQTCALPIYLFSLFVFFEVLLAASYGLVLRGDGAARVRTGLHYIAVNVAASFLFLIGVALIYGTVGTLRSEERRGGKGRSAPGRGRQS